MKINPIENNQNFQGKLIVKNKISTQQNYLFNLHKQSLEEMIKDMPFDLFVEQSKSKKTIALSTKVEGANTYVVKKNKQDFVEAAGYAISDAQEKSEVYIKMVKANEILWYVKQHMLYVITGKFKEAREVSKKIAELGTKNFDIYKAMTNFKLKGFPPEANKILLLNSIKYKLYRAFTRNTPEEKQLIKMNKAYWKEMKAQGKEIKPVELELPRIYY